jgi:signal transduction histidine kinase
MILSFGRKIAVGILVLVGATLGTVLAISDAWIDGSVRDKVARDLAGADETVAEVLRIRTHELQAQVRLLAGGSLLPSPSARGEQDADRVLARAVAARRLGGSDLLLVVDDRARLVASATEPDRRGDNLVGDPAVAAALQGQAFDAMISTEDGIWQVVAAPIHRDGRVEGAVVTGFVVGDALLANLEHMTGSLVALWSPAVAQVSNRARPVFGEIASRVVVAPGRSATIETTDGPYLVRVGEIGTSGVSYALARSLDEELAFLPLLRTRLLALGGMLLAIALATGWLWSRRITRPIEALVDGAARLAAGDLAARVEVGSGDELGKLATAFNRMANEIQALVEEERDLAAKDSARREELVSLNAELKVEIDERHEAEAEITRLNEDLEVRVTARTAELEAANRQLESFSYTVSHDLRGPLARIAGFSELLLTEDVASLAPAARDSVERIRNSATAMTRLIEKLLEFAHVGRSELEREPIDLTTMAREIAGELAIGDRTRRTDFVIPDGLVGSGDPELVGVALQNLLSNAWKFTSHSPRPRIEVGAEAGNGTGPVFYVRDNGAGFEAADSQRVFRVFERLHHSREFDGHGIGLATVRRIVEHHGGKVWATSAPGAGATFRFTLGVAAQSAAREIGA